MVEFEACAPETWGAWPPLPPLVGKISSYLIEYVWAAGYLTGELNCGPCCLAVSVAIFWIFSPIQRSGVFLSLHTVTEIFPV